MRFSDWISDVCSSDLPIAPGWLQMSYVDAFRLAVPKKKLATYRKMAKAASRIFREHCAIDFRECAGDDFAAAHGTPFPKLLKLNRGETVVFSWIAFKSRAHRDRVNKKIMADRSEKHTSEL